MEKVKYPRTYHLPFSKGYTSDDKVLESDEQFKGKEVVVTIKMDGENTTIYPNGDCHARSLDSLHKEYHSWLLSFIYTFVYKMPQDIRICGEYLFAKHSIFYDNLKTYFMVFSIWKEDGYCLAWNEMEELCKTLGLITTPVVYKGIYDTEKIKKLAEEVTANGQEGIVVRVSESFHINDFNKNIAKYVRKNHVQTDKHWQYSKIEKNLLEK